MSAKVGSLCAFTMRKGVKALKSAFMQKTKHNNIKIWSLYYVDNVSTKTNI